MDRFERQLQFIIEVDKLKTVLRRTLLTDGSRRENSAEHSWHIALMAPLLAEYACEPVDVGRVMRMLLVHDIVEIDAGDTFAYDANGNADKEARERRAADRLYGLLPEDQARDLREAWQEFEAAESAEARFAHALDRLQPLLLNLHHQGGTWRTHGITREQVLERMRPIETTCPGLWSFVVSSINDVWAKGRVRTLDDLDAMGAPPAETTGTDRT